MELKSNKFIRGIYFWYRSYFGYKRSAFGHIGENVVLTPPIHCTNTGNIYIGDNVGIADNAHLSCLNAKLIIKGNAAISHNFVVHTGNHAHLKGMFITDITEANKPKGYDEDVVIEKDV